MERPQTGELQDAVDESLLPSATTLVKEDFQRHRHCLGSSFVFVGDRYRPGLKFSAIVGLAISLVVP